MAAPLNAVPSNFYYYKPVSEIADLPPGLQKITTQWPTNVTLIHVAVCALFAAGAVAVAGGLTIWSWPVVIISASYALYTVYKQLLTQDPLVGVFYDIAGSKDAFDRLPEYPLPTGYKKLSDVVKEINWNELEHPVYRALTADGRKVMIIKGLNTEEEGIRVPVPTRAVMAFVEKLGPYDVAREISNLNEGIESFFYAIAAFKLENPYGKLRTPQMMISNGVATRHSTSILGSISYDMAYEFRDQLGQINTLGPSIEPID